MITPTDRHYHAAYEAYTNRIAIDEAYAAARRALEEAGITVSNMDPAEAFVAAIMRYVVESNPRDPAIQNATSVATLEV